MSTTINIAYLKVDIKNLHIVDYNAHLLNMFDLSQLVKYQSVSTIINFLHIVPQLSKVNSNESQSIIIFCNSRINGATDHNSMLILYAIINKCANYYSIRLVNWLNWLHQISNSLEHNYNLMSKFNETTSKDKFSKISDAYCYKALHPLMTYIPQKFSNGISQSSLFEIMRIFVKRREESKYTKDYARNVYSRIKTNLRQEVNLDNFDAVDIIKNKKLLNIEYKRNLFIPNTLLHEDIILSIEHDQLLTIVIESIYPL